MTTDIAPYAGNAPAPILRVKDLKKTFGTDDMRPVQVLKGISFDIMPGEFVAVLGPSGSGKSTLVHCLGTFEEPDDPASAPIQYAGTGGYRNIWDNWLWFRQNFIGIVFQSFHLLPNLDVGKNVELPLRLGHCDNFTTDPAQRRALVTTALKKLGMASMYDKEIRKLSGGECQRAAIARAMVKRPRLLLADEPTGNLDEHNKTRIIEELRSLAQGDVSVLMVTHDDRFACAYADRIIRLEDGIIISIENGNYMATKQAAAASAAGGPTSTLAPVALAAPDALGTFPPVVPKNEAEVFATQAEAHDASANGTQGDSLNGSTPVPTAETPADNEPQPASGTEVPADDPPTEHNTPDPAAARAAPVFGGVRFALATVGGQSGEQDDDDNGPVPASVSPSPSVPIAATALPKTLQHPQPKAGGLLRNLRLPGCDQRAWDIISFASRDARKSFVSLVSNVVAILFGTVLTGLLISLLVGTDLFIKEMMRKIPGIDAVHSWVDYSTGGDPISEAEFNHLKQWQGATFAVPNIQQFVTLYEKPGKDTIVTLTSAGSNDPEISRLKLQTGVTQLDPAGWDIVLNERVASDLNNFAPLSLVGKTIYLQLRKYTKDPGDADAKPTTVIDYPVRVVGIVASSPKDRVYASLNLVRFVRDFSTSRSNEAIAEIEPISAAGISARTLYEGVRVHFSSPEKAEIAFAQMKKQLPSRMDLYWPGSEMNYLRDIQSVTWLVLVGIGLITILAGAISVFNTLQASVARKTREIGILLALGVSRADIFVIFLWQALIVGVAAASVGLLIVWPSATALNRVVVEHWDGLKEVSKLTGGFFVLPLGHAVLIFLSVIAICLCAAYFPSRSASLKRPMDALRDPGS